LQARIHQCNSFTAAKPRNAPTLNFSAAIFGRWRRPIGATPRDECRANEQQRGSLTLQFAEEIATGAAAVLDWAGFIRNGNSPAVELVLLLLPQKHCRGARKMQR
jgi:hypothetical protein